jgi:NAD(P)-dependent dehydrogenase (short-subunit alcohol dehydrogenase family)
MKVTDMFSVKGYGAIVTGGASGLGLAFTEVLAENGARVTMLDLSAERIGAETKRLRSAGFDVRGAVVDVTDRPAVHGAFDEAVAEYGRLDVVFANAGIDSGPGFVTLDRKARVAEGAIENYDDARWNKVIETNLNSVFTTIKAAARHMKPRKSGRIIVTTSVAGLFVESGIGAAYMAAKAGAAHFMRTMALELARYNILVNAIAPGPFITNIGGGHAHRPEVQAAFAKTVPLGRMASTEEIKGLALFLASPASSFMTGSEIVIDGGVLLGTVE